MDKVKLFEQILHLVNLMNLMIFGLFLQPLHGESKFRLSNPQKSSVF